VYFPICLDIEQRICLVIGGGRVAERKVQSLLAHGGRVRVISPDLTPQLMELREQGALDWQARDYRDGDLAGAFLVIAATDDTEVQARVHAEAERCNILLNVADVPKWCNFILPATARRGDLAISVSTGGKSPVLASRLRQELEARFGPEYGELTEILGQLRPLVLAQERPHSENRELFSRLVHPDFPEWVRRRDWQSIGRHVREVLGPEVDLAGLETLLASGRGSLTGSSAA